MRPVQRESRLSHPGRPDQHYEPGEVRDRLIHRVQFMHTVDKGVHAARQLMRWICWPARHVRADDRCRSSSRQVDPRVDAVLLHLNGYLVVSGRIDAAVAMADDVLVDAIRNNDSQSARRVQQCRLQFVRVQHAARHNESRSGQTMPVSGDLASVHRDAQPKSMRQWGGPIVLGHCRGQAAEQRIQEKDLGHRR